MNRDLRHLSQWNAELSRNLQHPSRLNGDQRITHTATANTALRIYPCGAVQLITSSPVELLDALQKIVGASFGSPFVLPK